MVITLRQGARLHMTSVTPDVGSKKHFQLVGQKPPTTTATHGRATGPSQCLSLPKATLSTANAPLSNFDRTEPMAISRAAKHLLRPSWQHWPLSHSSARVINYDAGGFLQRSEAYALKLVMSCSRLSKYRTGFAHGKVLVAALKL